MTEFLDLYVRELNSKAGRIGRDYLAETSSVASELRRAFEKYWMPLELRGSSPSDFSVVAVDGGCRHIVTSNGGVFYVVRALALSKEKRYREVVADFDYTSDSAHDASRLIHRKMEWLEHIVALKAVDDGFKGFLLIDGSIYGRLMHIPIETGYVNDRAFMLQYFETHSELLERCRREKVIPVGISKESRTSLFREFLIREIAMNRKEELGLAEGELERLLSLALDNRRAAIKELQRLEQDRDVGFLRELMEELFARKPDFQLILSFAEAPGYTTPLLLGASARWRRSYRAILEDPKGFIKSNFTISSRSEDFTDWAAGIVEKMPQLPAVISFHLLPAVNDTPMRVDIPAWALGIDKKLSEVGWPEKKEVKLEKIIELISAGYCGLDNYNLWLTAADAEVRLTKKDFEYLYLPKFEEIVGRFATPRGYRRVRFS